MKIKDYLQAKLNNGNYEQQYRLGMEMSISTAQLSHYLTGRTRQPSLELAREIFIEDSIIIWPYSEESVQGKD